MLILKVTGGESFNEETQEFDDRPDFVLELEHSLVSLSKWESRFHKPFLDSKAKSNTEILSYIESMILNPIYPENIVSWLSNDNLREIKEYIESPASATTFGQMPERGGRGEVITSELIYYWLVAFNVPFEVERWHLNRLFALVRICNIKNQNQKPTKQGKADMARRNRELNAQRKAQYNTSG
jgi:hypothetical protein